MDQTQNSPILVALKDASILPCDDSVIVNSPNRFNRTNLQPQQMYLDCDQDIMMDDQDNELEITVENSFFPSDDVTMCVDDYDSPSAPAQKQEANFSQLQKQNMTCEAIETNCTFKSQINDLEVEQMDSEIEADSKILSNQTVNRTCNTLTEPSFYNKTNDLSQTQKDQTINKSNAKEAEEEEEYQTSRSFVDPLPRVVQNPLLEKTADKSEKSFNESIFCKHQLLDDEDNQLNIEHKIEGLNEKFNIQLNKMKNLKSLLIERKKLALIC